MSAPAAREVWIEGVALWTPRLPGWPAARSILRGDIDAPAEPAARPSPAILPPTERRRAPDTVAVALEVAARACESAGRDPQALQSVFASTHGDLVVTDYMCETLAKTPALTSPTKFHNSVHNAAAGYWCIATGCLRPYTALSAFEHTFGIALLEAASQAVCEEEPVLLVAYDIEARGPLATMARSEGLLGAALVLAPERTARSQARIHYSSERGSGTTRPSECRAANAALVAGNAMAGCLPLFEALADGGAHRIVQTISHGSTLIAELESC